MNPLSWGKWKTVNETNNLQKNGTYAANTLYKTVSIDEDGKSNTEYKDKLGRTVLVRNANDVDTYYVYNDLDQNVLFYRRLPVMD